MIEHLKILSHPAAWTIFATDIIGWNCRFHLMIASTSSAVCRLCPIYCQSYCSSIYDGYTGSTLLEATNSCTQALPLGFFSGSASGWSWGELRVCVGSPNVTFPTYLLLRAFLWTYVTSFYRVTAGTIWYPATPVLRSTCHTAGPMA